MQYVETEEDAKKMTKLRKLFGVLRSNAVCVRDKGVAKTLGENRNATAAVDADFVTVRYYPAQGSTGFGDPDDMGGSSTRMGPSRRQRRRCGSSNGTACDGLADVVCQVPRHRVRVVGLQPRQAARMSGRAVRAHKLLRTRRAAARRLAAGQDPRDAAGDGKAGALLDEQERLALEEEALALKRQRLLRAADSTGPLDGGGSSGSGHDSDSDSDDEAKQQKGRGLARRLARSAMETFTAEGRERRHHIPKGAELAVRVTSQRFCRLPKCRGPERGAGCDLKTNYVAATRICHQCLKAVCARCFLLEHGGSGWCAHNACAKGGLAPNCSHTFTKLAPERAARRRGVDVVEDAPYSRFCEVSRPKLHAAATAEPRWQWTAERERAAKVHFDALQGRLAGRQAEAPSVSRSDAARLARLTLAAYPRARLSAIVEAAGEHRGAPPVWATLAFAPPWETAEDPRLRFERSRVEACALQAWEAAGLGAADRVSFEVYQAVHLRVVTALLPPVLRGDAALMARAPPKESRAAKAHRLREEATGSHFHRPGAR